MKRICQLYAPSFYRSYGKNALNKMTEILPMVEKAGFNGVYLIALWQDGGADNGFDVVSYTVNKNFGTEEQLQTIIDKAHELGMEIGVDVVPNHASDQCLLANHAIEHDGDELYIVTKEEAEKLTEAGVPSFFGKLAYSPFGDKYVRSTFADYHQLNLNWNSEKVQFFFRSLFEHLNEIGIDFVRVDCGMMLLEDVTKACRENPFACMNPEASIQAIVNVAQGMPLFFEWFDPSSASLFDNLDNCYALDCSYVMSGKQNLDWANTSAKLVPLLGGHDQMTIEDRGICHYAAMQAMGESKAEYGFLDIQTLIGWKTEVDLKPGDEEYDADLQNHNQRFRARREIAPILDEFKKYLASSIG